jgi:hypothetical protein
MSETPPFVSYPRAGGPDIRAGFRNAVLLFDRTNQTMLAALITFAGLYWASKLGGNHIHIPAPSALAVGGLFLSGLFLYLLYLVSSGRLAGQVFGASSVPFIVLLLAFSILPCLALILLLVIQNRARKVLREYGVKPGFIGISKEQVQRVEASFDVPEVPKAGWALLDEKG